jgi:hypothetical protein
MLHDQCVRGFFQKWECLSEITDAICLHEQFFICSLLQVFDVQMPAFILFFFIFLVFIFSSFFFVCHIHSFIIIVSFWFDLFHFMIFLLLLSHFYDYYLHYILMCADYSFISFLFIFPSPIIVFLQQRNQKKDFLFNS